MFDCSDVLGVVSRGQLRRQRVSPRPTILGGCTLRRSPFLFASQTFPAELEGDRIILSLKPVKSTKRPYGFRLVADIYSRVPSKFRAHRVEDVRQLRLQISPFSGRGHASRFLHSHSLKRRTSQQVILLMSSPCTNHCQALIVSRSTIMSLRRYRILVPR
jgi:hypothetical protein